MKVLVACFPKSGSTFLTNLIGNLNEFTVASWVPSYGHREQELDETLIVLNFDSPHQVAQHHVRASEYTREIIDRHDIKLIVLVRNIFDALVSLAEHTARQSAIYPMAFFEESMSESSFHEILDAVVDLAAPWYINFYASWYSNFPSRIIRYEDIILSGSENRSLLLSKLGVAAPSEMLAAAATRISPESTRFNVGRSGRGKRLLSKRQVQRVTDLTSHYRNVDFSSIGIESIDRRYGSKFTNNAKINSRPRMFIGSGFNVIRRQLFREN